MLDERLRLLTLLSSAQIQNLTAESLQKTFAIASCHWALVPRFLHPTEVTELISSRSRKHKLAVARCGFWGCFLIIDAACGLLDGAAPCGLPDAWL